MNKVNISPGGGIGRHKGLKIPRQKYRAGSSPASGTTLHNFSDDLDIAMIQNKRIKNNLNFEY